MQSLDRRRFLGAVGVGFFTLLNTRPVFALESILPGAARASEPSDADVLIAFGSCNNQIASQGHWTRIASLNPDAWIWLGDSIYSDLMPAPLRKLSYKRVKNSIPYKKFESQVRIIGTWDDHDYGLNNSGGDLPYKDESQVLFLDFLGIPKDDPRRSQRGVYNSQLVEKNGLRIKVILLDLRYFRERSGPTAGLLGAEQWRWLEQEIDDGQSADLILIGSSVQFAIIDGETDNWNGFPAERERLRALLSRSRVPSVVLSGDIHRGEISRVPFEEAASGQKWLYDVTSSGLTHFAPEQSNDQRIGPTCAHRNFAILKIKRASSGRGVEILAEIRRIDGSVFYSHLLEGLS